MNHEELDIDTEEAATIDAVNFAALESLDGDTEDTPLVHGCDTITLADGEPDLKISIDADESKSRYLYQMVDTGASLSHMACGTLLGADASGLRLYALMGSLESVLCGRILERLCGRYGYMTKASALASRKQLIVTIASTDPKLIEAGTIIRNSIEAGALPFLAATPARDAWQAVTLQLCRFEIRWELIPADAPGLSSLNQWAEAVLVDCPHDGPIYSPARKLAA